MIQELFYKSITNDELILLCEGIKGEGTIVNLETSTIEQEAIVLGMGFTALCEVDGPMFAFESEDFGY